MSSQELLKDRFKNKLNRLLHSFVPGRLRLSSPNRPAGPSSLLSLPSELKYRIAELSSHGSLATLARTHTAFKREAEQALYRIVSNPSLICLETLATNSEKAGFVHFLTMECFYSVKKKKKEKDHRGSPIDYLLNALSNMHCLSDFRLRLPWGYEVHPWVEMLDKILCNGHFRLQTLCCDEALDLSRIITSQNELQKLGIYVHYGNFGFLGGLKQLQNAQIHLPVVFTLDHRHYEYIIRMSIFPAFYSIDRIPSIHQVFAEPLDKAQGTYNTNKIYELAIYLLDSCDLHSIHALTKNMAMTFPNITSLVFAFENPCEEIPSHASQEIKKIISLFPDLTKLDFEVWPPLDIGDGMISEEVKRAHEALAKDWVLACPGLISVSFIDGSTLEKDGSWESEWFLAESF